jgi:hypothetical protein
MPSFTKIEIHFRDPKRGDRRVVIRPRSGIDAIFLEGGERKYSITAKSQTRGTRRGRSNAEGTKSAEVKVDLMKKPPQGLSVEGEVFPGKVGVLRGPGEVCYLRNALLHCWDPEE